MNKQAQSSSVAVSPIRESWRESVIVGRATGLIRNRASYIRASLPKFIQDESHEIVQFLVGGLVEYIDKRHPSIEDMKRFVNETAAKYDLPFPDEQLDSVIAVAYFKWKAKILAGGYEIESRQRG